MKRMFKRIFKVFISALMCLLLVACNQKSSNPVNMLNLHEYLGMSEKDVLSYLTVNEDKIDNRQEKNEQVDIILKDMFEYNGANAKVRLSFVKDCLYSVEYVFVGATDNSSKEAVKYTKEIEKEFNKKYENPNMYSVEPSISELTEDTYMSTEENTVWRSDWHIEDRNEAISKLSKNSSNSELTVSLSIMKFNKDSTIKIFIWA